MEAAIKVIDYQIQQTVADYIKSKAVYESLKEEIKNLRDKVDSVALGSSFPMEIMRNVEYIKICLYELQRLEYQAEEMLKDIQSLEREIKLLNARKKALVKFFNKRAKVEEKKEVLRELEIAEEVYRSKLINNQ